MALNDLFFAERSLMGSYSVMAFLNKWYYSYFLADGIICNIFHDSFIVNRTISSFILYLWEFEPSSLLIEWGYKTTILVVIHKTYTSPPIVIRHVAINKLRVDKYFLKIIIIKMLGNSIIVVTTTGFPSRMI